MMMMISSAMAHYDSCEPWAVDIRLNSSSNDCIGLSMHAGAYNKHTVTHESKTNRMAKEGTETIDWQTQTVAILISQQI